MNKKTAIIFSVAVSLCIVLALFVLPSLPQSVQAQATGSSDDNDGAVTGWMWSSNIGWVRADSNSTNPVKVNNETGEWSGYAWSSSLGWIDFNPVVTPTNTYPSAPFHGVKTEENGKDITGWARACSVFVSGCSGNLKPDSARGSWDGWVKMVNVVRDPDTGGLSGYAWGSLNLGYLSFGFPSTNPPIGCSLAKVDTNCDSTPECDPCSQVCVRDCDPGGGPRVVCKVEPPTGDLDTSFTWYVESLSGFSGEPEEFTYTWTSNNEDGPSGPGSWNNAEGEGRNQIVVTYGSAGSKIGGVTVSDSSGNTATDLSCSSDSGEGIVINNCANVGEPYGGEGQPVSCCPGAEDNDIPPDFICGVGVESCSVSINENDSYGIELYFNVSTPRYNDGSGDILYRSTSNQKVTLSGGCNDLNIEASGLPDNVNLICSPANGTENWGQCTNLTQGDYLVGVYAASRPDGVDCQDLNLSIGEEEGSSVSTEVCFAGSVGN